MARDHESQKAGQTLAAGEFRARQRPFHLLLYGLSLEFYPGHWFLGYRLFSVACKLYETRFHLFLRNAGAIVSTANGGNDDSRT